jgi:hypothetical protein
MLHPLATKPVLDICLGIDDVAFKGEQRTGESSSEVRDHGEA